MKRILLSIIVSLFISNTKAQSIQPFAQLDTANVICSSLNRIDVLANDSIPSFAGSPLIIGSELNWGGRYYCSICASKENGIFRTIGDTIIEYIPPNNFYGWDEILYLLTDSATGLRNHFDSARVAIFVDSCNTVGISKIAINSSFKLFPNPTHSISTITFDPSEIENELKVYNLTGAVAFEYSNVNSGSKELDLTELSKGIYIVELKQGNSIIRKKLIKN